MNPDFIDLLRAFTAADVRFLTSAHMRWRCTDVHAPPAISTCRGENAARFIGRKSLIRNKRALGRTKDQTIFIENAGPYRTKIALKPHVASLRTYDNSVEAGPGEPVPDPVLVLEMERGRIVFPQPDDAAALAVTPHWAKPLVEVAIAGRRGGSRGP